MKTSRIASIITLVLLTFCAPLSAQIVPTPKDFLGFEPGDHHVSHDQVLYYMRAVATSSPRVIAIERGTSYEGRPLIFLIISSEENIKNIDKIKENQQKLTDPSQSGKLDLKSMPAVVWLGYSVHGNEASGVNASLDVVYNLATAKDNHLEKMLNDLVIIVQPAQNPDGIQRFAGWVNSARSYAMVTDPMSREFREPAPSGRSNHYWFDLNRDWLPVQHPESYYRMEIFHEWHPVLVNDYHEQGSTNGSYFSPGIKNSTNTLVPELNRTLTEEISLYHAQFLENEGVLFFTKEGYDNFYTGKGASYPDMMGAIGVLYEQPSSRGHFQIRNGVELKFKDIIMYQALCSYSAITAAYDKRERLNRYKADFYRENWELAERGTAKGYVVSTLGDAGLMRELVRILNTHNIDLYTVRDNITIEGTNFYAGNSYYIPYNQKEYRLLRTLFDKITEYKDSTFYDVSAWTLPLALNLQYKEIINPERIKGDKVKQIDSQISLPPVASSLAYLFELTESSSYSLLYNIMREGINVRISDLPFSIEISGKEIKFTAGTVMIPVRGQKADKDALYNKLKELSSQYMISLYGATTSFGKEFDLGSAHFRRITSPKVALIVGRGASYGTLGEIWHLLDQKYSIPASILDAALLNDIDLREYNTIILAGNYRFPKEINDRLKEWSMLPTNRIIAIEQSYLTLNEIGVSDIKESMGRDNAPGVILKSRVNKSSPLFYGVNSQDIYFFKRGRIFVSPGAEGTVASYTKNPLMSGYLSAKALEKVQEAPAVLAGRGAIYFTDSPNFRAYWYGTSILLLNAIIFRELFPGGRISSK